MANKKYSGLWHLPNSTGFEVQKFDGVLEISELGLITLSAILETDEFESKIPGIKRRLNQINNQEPIEIVNGYAKDTETNKDISFTLINLKVIAYSQSGLIYIKFEAKNAITFCQIKEKGNLTFDYSMMKFDGLDDWLDVYGFNITSHEESVNHKTTIVFTQPEPIEILDDEDVRAYFYFRTNSPLLANTSTLSFSQSVYLNFNFKKKKNIDFILRHTERIQNFFSFVSNYPSKRLSHEIQMSETFTSQGIYYWDKAANFRNDINKQDFLFKYSTFENKSKQLIPNWLELYQKYELPLDQYFDLKYNNHSHLTSRLISILSILEISYIKLNENDPNLASKLNNLIATKSSIFNLLPISNGEMVSQIVAVRRYLVHGKKSQDFKEENLLEKSMIKFIFQLENIFKIYMLSEMGITDDEITILIINSPWQWGIE